MLILFQGLRKARTLKTLLLRNYSLGDSGVESVCQAVKNVPSITHLSLVNCGVTERGSTSVACLIKVQVHHHKHSHISHRERVKDRVPASNTLAYFFLVAPEAE